MTETRWLHARAPICDVKAATQVARGPLTAPPPLPGCSVVSRRRRRARWPDAALVQALCWAGEWPIWKGSSDSPAVQTELRASLPAGSSPSWKNLARLNLVENQSRYDL